MIKRIFANYILILLSFLFVKQINSFSGCDDVNVFFLIDTYSIINDNNNTINQFIKSIIWDGSSEHTAFSVILYGNYDNNTINTTIISLMDNYNITQRQIEQDNIIQQLDITFEKIRKDNENPNNKSVSLMNAFKIAETQLKPHLYHKKTERLLGNYSIGLNDGENVYFIFDYYGKLIDINNENDLCYLLNKKNESVHFLFGSEYDTSDIFCGDNYEYPHDLIDETNTFFQFNTDLLTDTMAIEIIYNITCPSVITIPQYNGSINLGNHIQWIDIDTIINCNLTLDPSLRHIAQTIKLDTNLSYILVKDYVNDDNTFKIDDYLLSYPQIETQLKLIGCWVLAFKIKDILIIDENENDDYNVLKLFVSLPSTPFEYILNANVEGVDVEIIDNNHNDSNNNDSISNPTECTFTVAGSSYVSIDGSGLLVDWGVKLADGSCYVYGIGNSGSSVMTCNNGTATRFKYDTNNCTGSYKTYIGADMCRDGPLSDKDCLSSDRTSNYCTHSTSVAIGAEIDLIEACGCTPDSTFYDGCPPSSTTTSTTTTLNPITDPTIDDNISLQTQRRRSLLFSNYDEEDTLSLWNISSRNEWKYNKTGSMDIVSFGDEPKFILSGDGTITITAGRSIDCSMKLYFKFKWDFLSFTDIYIKFYLTVDWSVQVWFYAEFIGTIIVEIEKLLSFGQYFYFWIGPVPVAIKPFIQIDAKLETIPIRVYTGFECYYGETYIIGYEYEQKWVWTWWPGIKTTQNEIHSRSPHDNNQCTKTFDVSVVNEDDDDEDCPQVELGFDVSVSLMIGVNLYSFIVVYAKGELVVPFRINVPEFNDTICDYASSSCSNTLLASFNYGPMDLSFYFGYWVGFDLGETIEMLIGGGDVDIPDFDIDVLDNEHLISTIEILPKTNLGCITLNGIFSTLNTYYKQQCCDDYYLTTTTAEPITGVIIDPTSTNEYAIVTLTLDPRNINTNTDNYWEVFQSYDNPLYDWALKLNLIGEKYSFKPNIDGSSITISIDGECETNECDVYFAFGIGSNQQYLTFTTDLDGGQAVSGANLGRRQGILIYPNCQNKNSSIAIGDPSTLIPTDELNYQSIRSALSGGNVDNFQLLTTTANGENFPITFEFENNDISNTFIFRFLSPTFSDNNILECQYDSSVTTRGDFNLYLSPDGDNEILRIKTIQINGVSTGYTPTTSYPTTANPITANPTTTYPTTTNPTTENPTSDCIKYKYVDRVDTPNDGRTLCKNLGSTLATIRDDNDLVLYKQAWFDQGLPYNATNQYGLSVIGLSDRITEGEFLWDDGTKCNVSEGDCFSFWSDGQPNNWKDQDCTIWGFNQDMTPFVGDVSCTQYYTNQLYVFCNCPIISTDNLTAIDTSTSADVVVICDRFGTYYVSRDNGITYTEFVSDTIWNQITEFTVDKVDSNTILKYQCESSNNKGGIVSTIYFNGKEYYTTDPIEDGYFETDEQELENYQRDDVNTDGLNENAYWIWNGEEYNTMEIYFNFSRVLIDDYHDITTQPTASPTLSDDDYPLFIQVNAYASSGQYWFEGQEYNDKKVWREEGRPETDERYIYWTGSKWKIHKSVPSDYQFAECYNDNLFECNVVEEDRTPSVRFRIEYCVFANQSTDEYFIINETLFNGRWIFQAVNKDRFIYYFIHDQQWKITNIDKNIIYATCHNQNPFDCNSGISFQSCSTTIMSALSLPFQQIDGSQNGKKYGLSLSWMVILSLIFVMILIMSIINMISCYKHLNQSLFSRREVVQYSKV